MNGGVLSSAYFGKIGDPVPSAIGGACCFRWVSYMYDPERDHIICPIFFYISQPMTYIAGPL